MLWILFNSSQDLFYMIILKCCKTWEVSISQLVQFSCSVVSNSLRPQEPHTPGLPVNHQLRESTQTHIHCVGNFTVKDFLIKGGDWVGNWVCISHEFPLSYHSWSISCLHSCPVLLKLMVLSDPICWLI